LLLGGIIWTTAAGLLHLCAQAILGSFAMTEFDWLYLVIMPVFVVCVGGVAVWASRFIP
jgi:hypothetical protein